jgi:hypothetical protein
MDDWNPSVTTVRFGMFADDPAMQEIDEEGHRSREADRQQARS